MVVAGKARRHQLDARDSTELDGHFAQCGKSASTMAGNLQSSPSMLRIINLGMDAGPCVWQAKTTKPGNPGSSDHR